MWTQKDMPDLTGSTVVVTGANSGIGLEVTRAFAQKGAHVVMACRNVKRAKTAANYILKEFSDASLEIMRIDLNDLSSVKDFAHKFSERYQLLHILCNNAGIMLAPQVKTVDGFELHLGVNHLGHFALTGLLLHPLLATENARIITMSSIVHHRGDINVDDLNWEKSYSRIGAYGRSKLANLLFTYELQQRLEAVKSTTISVAAHPGWAATNLQSTGLHMGGGRLWRFAF